MYLSVNYNHRFNIFQHQVNGFVFVEYLVYVDVDIKYYSPVCFYSNYCCCYYYFFISIDFYLMI